MSIENIIFSNLVYKEEYTRKVLPFLKTEYFLEHKDKIVFELISDYFSKYNKCPTIDALAIDLSNKNGVSEQSFKDCKETIGSLEKDENSLDWLCDSTESFVQEKAIHNALLKSINIVDDKTGKLDKGIIPSILSDAIGVSFDSSVGHDFIENANERFEYYHRKEAKIPFDITYLNQITAGGFSPKTLNMFMGSPGAGKTLVMCHMAAYNLMCGHNVLYITMEMSEEEISRRIDANLLDIPIAELSTIPKDIFDAKIARVKSKTKGKLIVKEYPTTGASANNFRHLIHELKIKKNFKAAIAYIDYLNICASSRLKISSAVNSYTLVKAVGEEIRGLACEEEIPMVSATQSNRDGYGSSELSMSNISDSAGTNFTADFLVGISTSEQLAELNQLMFKQLGKNRYFDSQTLVRAVVGIDRMKMRLYDCDEGAQTLINDDKPVIDSGKFFTEYTGKKKFGKDLFSGFS